MNSTHENINFYKKRMPVERMKMHETMLFARPKNNSCFSVRSRLKKVVSISVPRCWCIMRHCAHWHIINEPVIIHLSANSNNIHIRMKCPHILWWSIEKRASDWLVATISASRLGCCPICHMLIIATFVWHETLSKLKVQLSMLPRWIIILATPMVHSNPVYDRSLQSVRLLAIHWWEFTDIKVSSCII